MHDDECRALAERLDGPVCSGYQHNDSFPGSHPPAAVSLGYNGSKAAMGLIAQADVVLARGNRLSPFSTQPAYGIDGWPREAVAIQVEMNPDRIGLTPHISHSVFQAARRCAWHKLTPPLTGLEMHIEIRQTDNPVEALAGGSATCNLVIGSPDWLFSSRYGDNGWLRPS